MMMKALYLDCRDDNTKSDEIAQSYSYHCTNVNNLVLILDYSNIQGKSWEKLYLGCIRPLAAIFTTYWKTTDTIIAKWKVKKKNNHTLIYPKK